MPGSPTNLLVGVEFYRPVTRPVQIIKRRAQSLFESSPEGSVLCGLKLGFVPSLIYAHNAFPPKPTDLKYKCTSRKGKPVTGHGCPVAHIPSTDPHTNLKLQTSNHTLLLFCYIFQLPACCVGTSVLLA